MENVKKESKDKGKIKYSSRLNKLNWDNVAFDKYSADDCKKHFNLLLKKARTFRILDEIIDDIETTLTKVPYKKPLNSYHLFMKDMCGREPNEGVRICFFYDTVVDYPSNNASSYSDEDRYFHGSVFFSVLTAVLTVHIKIR